MVCKSCKGSFGLIQAYVQCMQISTHDGWIMTGRDDVLEQDCTEHGVVAITPMHTALRFELSASGYGSHQMREHCSSSAAALHAMMAA